MRNYIRMSFLVGAAVLLSACVAQDKYHWGSYEQDLLTYYRDSDQETVLVANLGEAIITGEENGKVPPGLYAEYGYLLLESGQAKESIVFFSKEQTTWPESATLMNAMIRVAEGEIKKK